MIFRLIIFIQISRSRGGENFGGNTEKDLVKYFNHVIKNLMI